MIISEENYEKQSHIYIMLFDFWSLIFRGMFVIFVIKKGKRKG